VSEIKARGYLIPATARYLRENVDAQEWERIKGSLSPQLAGLLEKGPEPAGWYPIAQLGELHKHIEQSMGRNDDERAQKALYESARYAASEASNTFLRLVLKMLSPALIAKKVPDLFKRDFSSNGTVTIEVSGDKITGRMQNLDGFAHCGVLCPGFLGFAVEATGGTVDKVEVHEWSLKKPNVDGTWYELYWH
jgi:hypothetical protein